MTLSRPANTQDPYSVTPREQIRLLVIEICSQGSIASYWFSQSSNQRQQEAGHGLFELFFSGRGRHPGEWRHHAKDIVAVKVMLCFMLNYIRLLH